MIIEFNGNTPKIQSGVFLANSADVIGDVVLAAKLIGHIAKANVYFNQDKVKLAKEVWQL